MTLNIVVLKFCGVVDNCVHLDMFDTSDLIVSKKSEKES